MKRYKAIYHLFSHDHEMSDGTFETNIVHLVYEELTEMEVHSIFRLLEKGAEDVCYIEFEVFEMDESDQEELKEVV